MWNFTRYTLSIAVLCLCSSSLAYGSFISAAADAVPGEGCFNCGFIGIYELNIVLSDWNQNVPPANPLADWSGDGYVGIDDLNAVLSQWNAGTPPGELFGCFNSHGNNICGDDGFVGIDDVNLILSYWNQNAPPADPRADNTGDGYIGIDDLSEVLANWNAGTPPDLGVGCGVDRNCDGFVGIDDLDIVLGNWNIPVPPANPMADHSNDGYIGIDDLNAVLSQWNAGTPPAAATVPEPAAIVMLGLGASVMLQRSGRRPSE